MTQDISGESSQPRLPALRQTKEDIDINRKIALCSGSKTKIEKKLFLGSRHEEIIPKGKGTVLSYNSKKLEAVHIDEV